MRRLLLSLLLVLAACTSEVPEVSPETSVATFEAVTSTTAPSSTSSPTTTESTTSTTVALTQTESLIAQLRQVPTEGPVRVGLVAHRASTLPEGRTIDLIDEVAELELVRIFAPEHGLAGDADAGELVDDGVEPLTGAPVVSLYGSDRSPSASDLADLDVIVYDLQDVGVRAYTYIATMGLVMEEAARNDIPFMVVDRPNPQGDVIDGPILQAGLESFISPYPIPPAYGLTSGELASLLVGEDMVAGDLDLTVVGPTSALPDEWIPPSPNLVSYRATWLYPALFPFEATVLSVGRGTTDPFTVLGASNTDVDAVLATTGGRQLIGLDLVPTTFTPVSIPGMSDSPRYEGRELTGIKFTTSGALDEPMRVSVELLDAFMDAAPNRAGFIDRPDVFDRLFGSSEVRQALVADERPQDVAALWADDVQSFTRTANRYRNR